MTSAESRGLLAYSVRDVRSAENVLLAAVAEGTLMQRAAAALAAHCARLLKQTGSGLVTGRRVVLLVGAGNNGGDALWAGARLARRGAAVQALQTGTQIHPEGLAALLAAGGTQIDATQTRADAADAPALLAIRQADLVIDGLVGLGARPGLREPATTLVAAIRPGTTVVAVDLPSGVDPETGQTPAAHVRADLTVTFGAAKPCLLLPPASVAAGVVRVVDLGFGPHLPEEPLVERLSMDDVARLWPVPDPGADKYRRGVLGVVAGSAGYPGAAVLSVSGALRAGVGMIRYLGPADATAAVRAAWPEVVAGSGRVQAWVLGPGVAVEADDDQPSAIVAALASDQPCLLDAGALTVLGQQLQKEQDGGSAVPDRSDRLLLTPHAGELARLLTDLADGGASGEVQRADVEREPYRHALLAAQLTGATVLLKGSTTLVVRPDGRARSQAEAPSWLATAGAGDVLAGIAGALLAAGLSPFDAGAVAALVHGKAAAAASGGGPIVSGDIADHLQPMLAALLTETHLR
ncbi:MAG TPA: NAD(P)H-hydrate epimerase [Kineosporiaceae bacterium]|nr:NAD(P)H-hydrate epimerase [Kineosporiaceae bacterium]